MTISRKKQLEILRKMSEEDIDYSDNPSATDEELGRVRVFIPPAKKTITIKLDLDVLEWFKKEQPIGYQTLINAVLSEYVAKKNAQKRKNL
jgi:uncharacterized protein (DUF4415 family)